MFAAASKGSGAARRKLRPRSGPELCGYGQIARTVLRNLPTSSLRRFESFDSDFAADSTCEEESVSEEPRFTSVILHRRALLFPEKQSGPEGPLDQICIDGLSDIRRRAPM